LLPPQRVFGLGYPQGLADFEGLPLANPVACANLFDPAAGTVSAGGKSPSLVEEAL